jgi:hypothetical protein
MHDKNCHKIVGNVHENQPCGMYAKTSSFGLCEKVCCLLASILLFSLIVFQGLASHGVNLQMQISFVCLAMFKYFVLAKGFETSLWELCNHPNLLMF